MFDLHLHTTASDGRCAPRELVRRAWAAGIRGLSVTDHDTTGGVAEAAAEAALIGMAFVPGIEITTVHESREVHVLCYGLFDQPPALRELLLSQRARRRARALEICGRLEKLGAPIDVDALVGSAGEQSGRALARPQIAAELVAAGHVHSVSEAFDRYLAEGSPAYVPHQGVSPSETVAMIVRHGGVASLAHPGLLGRDDLIPVLMEAGMTCVEVFHSSHDEVLQRHYAELARDYCLHATGGSDYHGEGTRRAELFGAIGLSEAAFAEFKVHLADAWCPLTAL